MKTPEECQKAKDELTAHRGLKKYYFLCKMEKKKADGMSTTNKGRWILNLATVITAAA